MKKRILMLLIILLAVGIFRWQHPVTRNDGMGAIMFTVTERHLQEPLHFTGIIQPLKETALTCPIDAVVETMPYHYGQAIKAGEIVLTLHSNELEKQYNDALTDYLKAKDNFNIAQVRFNGTQALWDAGLIAKNNFVSEQSTVNTAHIALMQSTQKLKSLLRHIDTADDPDWANLDLTQFKKVQAALNRHHYRIRLQAPTSGILLYPPKVVSDETSSQVSVGATLKTGQVITLIGDVTGIHVDIDIPETDINKIHDGMSAKITGAAFGRQILEGKVVRVNTQAMPGSTGKAPSFSATIEVSHLTDEQRVALKIGMSAAIELLFEEDQKMLIPIKAIRQVNGRRMVTVQHPDGKTEIREVVTGLAEANQVVIDHGLKPGEVIRYEV